MSDEVDIDFRIVHVDPIEPNTYNRRLIWLAGFIDADGSIGLSRPTCQQGYVGQLQVAGTDPRALTEICAIYTHFGVKYNLSAVRNDLRGLQVGRARHARAFNVNVTKFSELVKILPLILPFLVLKQDRASLVLEVAERRVAAMLLGRGANAGPYTDRDHEVFAMCRALQTSYKEFANVIA